MKIGVIGNGFVGKATSLLKCDDINVKIYDANPKLCVPLGTTMNDLSDCEVIFIAVPTPMNHETGQCHLNIVESVVNELYDKHIVQEPNNFIVIRSTVLPGTSDRLNCYFMPEFLTEKNFEYDFKSCTDWIFGLKGNEINDHIFQEKITKLFTIAKNDGSIMHDSVHFVPNKEAEMTKYFRNCFLATKVSFCNEIYEYCKLLNIDYDVVREMAIKDARIGQSHTSVPGHDGHKGYGGTCFPKDTKALLFSMKEKGMKSFIMEGINYRNDNVDRPERDWSTDKGRAII